MSSIGLIIKRTVSATTTIRIAPSYTYTVRVGAWRKQDFFDSVTLISISMAKRHHTRPAESVAVCQRAQEGLRPAFACQSGLAPELDLLDKPVEGFILCRSPPYKHQRQLLVRVGNSIIQIETCFFLQHDRLLSNNQCRKRAIRSSMALFVHFSQINSSEESWSDTSFPTFAYYAETDYRYEPPPDRLEAQVRQGSHTRSFCIATNRKTNLRCLLISCS